MILKVHPESCFAGIDICFLKYIPRLQSQNAQQEMLTIMQKNYQYRCTSPCEYFYIPTSGSSIVSTSIGCKTVFYVFSTIQL